MHRYPTRFATMNRSFFPTSDVEWVPDNTVEVVFNKSKRAAKEDEEYFPENDCEGEADSYGAYVASCSKSRARADMNDLLDEDATDADYTVNLRGWNTSMGRRPMTRSMTRSAPVLNARVASLRSSRR